MDTKTEIRVQYVVKITYPNSDDNLTQFLTHEEFCATYPEYVSLLPYDNHEYFKLELVNGLCKFEASRLFLGDNMG